MARLRFDVAATAGASGVQLMSALVQTTLVALTLGATGKGQTSVALLVPTVVAITVGVGLAPACSFGVASGRAEPGAALRHGGRLVAWSTAVAAVLVGVTVATPLAIHVLPGIPRRAVVLALSGVPVLVARQATVGVMQGLRRLQAAAVVAAAQSTLWVVLVAVALLVLDGGVGAVVSTWLASQVAALVVELRLLDARSQWLRRGPLRDPELASYGLRSYPASLLQLLTYRVDLLLVNAWTGTAAAGVYSVAVRLAELVWYLPSAVGAAIFPRLAAERSTTAARRSTHRVFWWTLGLTAVGAAAVAALSPWLVPLVFGRSFRAAVTPLLILLPGVVLIGSGRVLSNAVSARGRPELNSVNAVLTLVATALLNVVLIPRHGIVGAAIASTVAYALNLGWAVLAHRRASGTPGASREVLDQSPPPASFE